MLHLFRLISPLVVVLWLSSNSIAQQCTTPEDQFFLLPSCSTEQFRDWKGQGITLVQDVGTNQQFFYNVSGTCQYFECGIEVTEYQKALQGDFAESRSYRVRYDDFNNPTFRTFTAYTGDYLTDYIRDPLGRAYFVTLSCYTDGAVAYRCQAGEVLWETPLGFWSIVIDPVPATIDFSRKTKVLTVKDNYAITRIEHTGTCRPRFLPAQGLSPRISGNVLSFPITSGDNTLNQLLNTEYRYEVPNIKRCWFQTDVVDGGGNSSSFDPIFLKLRVRDSGRLLRTQNNRSRYRIRRAIGGAYDKERYVTVYNGNPGLSSIRVGVNKLHRTKKIRLRRGERKVFTLDGGFSPGRDNNLYFTATGEKGGTASVVIADSPYFADN